MELFFVVNPTAGSGRAKERWKDVEKFLIENEIPYDVAFTKRRGHGILLSKKASENGYKAIFAVGGDGTVNEVANGILMSGKSPFFGVIPAGSGNDFAKSLGIGSEIEYLLNPMKREIDVALLRHGRKKRFFVNMSGMGFDSYVTENLIFKGLGGTIPYFTSVLISLFRYKSKHTIIKHDKGEFEQESFMISVANGTYVGGGMKISPFSKMDDGYLDVVIIPKLSAIDVLRYLPKTYNGGHINYPKIQILRTKKISVEADDMLVHVEGDVVAKAPVEIEIIERGMKVIVPRGKQEKI